MTSLKELITNAFYITMDVTGYILISELAKN